MNHDAKTPEVEETPAEESQRPGMTATVKPPTVTAALFADPEFQEKLEGFFYELHARVARQAR